MPETRLRAGVADRGEGAGDQRHHLFGGDVAADGLGRLREAEQVRGLTGEVRRDVRRERLPDRERTARPR